MVADDGMDGIPILKVFQLVNLSPKRLIGILG